MIKSFLIKMRLSYLANPNTDFTASDAIKYSHTAIKRNQFTFLIQMCPNKNISNSVQSIISLESHSWTSCNQSTNLPTNQPTMSLPSKLPFLSLFSFSPNYLMASKWIIIIHFHSPPAWWESREAII